MIGPTRAATVSDLAWIAPAAVRSHVIGAPSELEDIHSVEPWRIRVTDAGDAALLERWRPWLDDLAIAGMWCPPRRAAALVADLARIAADRGFARLIAPIVHEAEARSYLAAGMSVIDRVDVMAIEGRALARAAARAGTLALPTGAVVRDADETDLEAVSELDGKCFDPFWHYDSGMLRRLSAGGRLAVMSEGASIIGYTLCTLHGIQGSLGRIAVAPHLQHRGAGAALTADAVSWMALHGARMVVLSTEEGNTAALSLYRAVGFMDVPGRLVVLATGLPGGDEERG